MRTCDQCGVERPADSFSNGRDFCFRCHLDGVQLKFTYGKTAFHGPTGKELGDRERKLFRKKMGYEPEFVGGRAVLV